MELNKPGDSSAFLFVEQPGESRGCVGSLCLSECLAVVLKMKCFLPARVRLVGCVGYGVTAALVLLYGFGTIFFFKYQGKNNHTFFFFLFQLLLPMTLSGLNMKTSLRPKSLCGS